MNDRQPPRQRAFPDTLLRQQKEFLVSEVRRERQTRPRRSRSLVRRVGTVGALAVVALAAVSLSGVFGNNGPMTIDKALAAVTVADGEVLHVRITGVESDGSTFVQENWSWTEPDAGSAWKYRGFAEIGGQRAREVALDASGLHQVYDAATNSLLEMQDETVAGLTEPKVAGESYEQMIRELLASGMAEEDGNEQVGGRDAVRIVEKRPAAEGERSENTFLVDAVTGEPIEWRIMNEGENRILHFDIYEKLPGTLDNLSLLDLRAAYPDAAVYADPAAFEAALAKVPAE
ncbi:MAG: hypothetical protein JW990_21725 [Thermoleophilia bacterium]|nr:hypothetical protein [Thermoleophilia bacterium]